MRSFWKMFLLRGLVAMGFGPLVLAVVYGCIALSHPAETVTLAEASRGMLSLTALAFLCGGIGHIYTIERLPAVIAALIHGAVLYMGYLILYLFNDWIPRNPAALGAFTLLFVAVYAVIWAVIYLINRRRAAKITRKLLQK